MFKESALELSKDEKIVWEGKPKQGIVLRYTDIALIPFSIIWTIATLIFELVSFEPDFPIYLSIIGIPFLIIGLFLLIGRYILDTKRRKNIFYWITNKRIIIKGEKLRNTVQYYQILGIYGITIKHKDRKFGTIVLGNEQGLNFGRGLEIEEFYWLNPKRLSRLELIEKADDVFKIILDLQKDNNACRQQTL
jgi:hypothetical protein